MCTNLLLLEHNLFFLLTELLDVFYNFFLFLKQLHIGSAHNIFNFLLEKTIALALPLVLTPVESYFLLHFVTVVCLLFVVLSILSIEEVELVGKPNGHFFQSFILTLQSLNFTVQLHIDLLYMIVLLKNVLIFVL